MIQIRRFGSLAALVVLSLVLASCGLGGDDEEPTPTETPEEASLNAEPTPTELPSTPDDPFVLVTSTPEGDDRGRR
jgi:predicted small lipoprotein YifL